MNKTYKYTILTLFLAVVFVIGSMEGMNFILQARERQFLSESGRVVVEAPVRAWQERDSDMEGENEDNPVQVGYVLTAEQMEDVISSWDESMAVIHNPVNGQISMEEAMKAGEEWLTEMGMIENADAETHTMYARLSAAVKKESVEAQLEPYYSFWYVRYSRRSMLAFFYINAVTGKVWNADVTLYENLPEEVPYEKVYLFAELSGLQISETDTVIRNQEETQAFLFAGDSPLCAEMEFFYSPAGCSHYTDYGGELAEYDDGMSGREHVLLIFKLAVSKED